MVLFLEAQLRQYIVTTTQNELEDATGPIVAAKFFGEKLPELIGSLDSSVQATPRFERFFERLTSTFMDDCVLIACHLCDKGLSPEELPPAMLQRLYLVDLHRTVLSDSVTRFVRVNIAAYLEANIQARPHVDWSRYRLKYDLDLTDIVHVADPVSPTEVDPQTPNSAQTAQQASPTATRSTDVR